MSDPFPPFPSRKRRRGAQVGNSNAIKHGLYARRFPTIEGYPAHQDPEGLASTDCTAEINMIRLLMRRLVEKSDPNASISETIEILRTLSVASLCLARLIRVQVYANPSSYPSVDAFQEALAQVIQELNE